MDETPIVFFLSPLRLIHRYACFHFTPSLLGLVKLLYPNVCFVFPFLHDISFVPRFFRFSGYHQDLNDLITCFESLNICISYKYKGKSVWLTIYHWIFPIAGVPNWGYSYPQGVRDWTSRGTKILGSQSSLYISYRAIYISKSFWGY